MKTIYQLMKRILSINIFGVKPLNIMKDVRDHVRDLRRKFSHNKVIYNYYKTNYKKYALLSSTKTPFIKYYYDHTSSFEQTSCAKILHELGYQVDIIHGNSESKMDLEKYDVICGHGNIFQTYYENSKLSHKARTFCYAAGMHINYNNQATLTRVKDVFNKHGVWLTQSARFANKTWTHSTLLVDAIITLGNDVCANSYKKYFSGPVFALAAPFFSILDPMELIKIRSNNAKYHFLWFGSGGLIHKGLDLVLDYFKLHQNLYLHICGRIDDEPNFVKVYYNELYNSSNIITHGFIDIHSAQFKTILQQCAFVIFPSCSEGGSPSVLTAIGNGGLIPIITKETTVNTGKEIFINGFNDTAIADAITQALMLSETEIISLQIENAKYVLEHNTPDIYYRNLKNMIINIIKLK